MADTEHKFRYILKPGSDFKFVARMRTWSILSLLLLSASIASLFVNKSVRGDFMNWTIDFKGGTEIIYRFGDKNDPATSVEVDAGKVRAALEAAGVEGFDVSAMSWKDDDDKTVRGMTVRTPRFGALTPAQEESATAELTKAFGERGLEKLVWSGDRVFVRSKQLIDEAEMKAALAAANLEMKPVEETQAKLNATADTDTGEYNATFTVFGLDRQYELAIEQAIPEVDVQVMQSTGVGAKAGDKLRNDGIRSLFYAMLLIVLYLAFRFDIRYAPGAVVALLHDAIMVVGVFSVTWTEVSLTSVAAVLTVIGFSVNDTVIIFDRIRENMAKLKDKKIERIIDISLNETLTRTILTSLTLFLTTLTMNLFGTGLVKNFAFAMNIGIVVGTYSSIFLATPLFLWIHRTWYMGPAKPRRTADA